ncbi:hypothetical protein V2J09_016206 [Rumex salicifolius]
MLIQHAGGKKKMKVVVHEKENSYHSISNSDDEYLCSLPRSNDEEEHGSGERAAYKVESDANLKKLVWKVGMKFSVPEIFKEQVNRYGAFARYCIRWWKNQKMGAKCKEGCKWRIYASWDGARESFVVKSVNPIHTCNRQEFENTQVKRYAYDLLYGSIGHHHKKLGSYMAELQRADNNTNIVLLTNKARIPRAPDVFKRIYGLCNVINVHFPNVEHRNYARHIFANWHKKHKGDELKMHFWRAARTYTKADFEIALKDMGTVSKKAVEDFIKKNPMHFCRSHLKTSSRSEVIVNNLAEIFNGYILDARSKPLIYMLKEIRLKVMERLFNNRQLMRKQQSDDICPRIKTRLNQAKEEARQCVSLRASEAEFQIRLVHAENGIKGIPCCYAISSLNSIRVEPGSLKEKYDESYNGSIRTICEEKHWPKINYPLDPPEVKIGAGKNELTKHGLQMTCSKCNGKSHNKRTCPRKDKMPINKDQPQEVKPRGRARKDGLPTKKAVEDLIQPKRKRGRPKKVVATKPHNGFPNGQGVYFGPNQRIYVNPD